MRLRSSLFIFVGPFALYAVVQAADMSSSSHVLSAVPYAGLPSSKMSVLAYDAYGIPVVLFNPLLPPEYPKPAMEFSILRKRGYFIKHLLQPDSSKHSDAKRYLAQTVNPSQRYEWIEIPPALGLESDCYAYERLPLIKQNTLRRSVQESSTNGWLSLEGIDAQYFLALKRRCKTQK